MSEKRIYCGGCRFYDSMPGLCRKNAPLVQDIEALPSSYWWPKVNKYDWCGEWIERHSPVDKLIYGEDNRG